jgi:hypothetical protein
MEISIVPKMLLTLTKNNIQKPGETLPKNMCFYFHMIFLYRDFLCGYTTFFCSFLEQTFLKNAVRWTFSSLFFSYGW